MKKYLVTFFILTLIIILTGCRQDTDTFEIAMITDVGSIDDESFNQGS